MADSMLVFAPHANSWRRFASRSYAPVAPTWGVNNRSVAVRVPAGPAIARRFEHRVAGVDANPYLVGAAALAGVRFGLNAHLDPGEPVTGNGYASAEGSGSLLPPDWRSAIEIAESSAFLCQVLGEKLHHTLIAIKKAELQRVSSTVTDLDYRLYLDAV